MPLLPAPDLDQLEELSKQCPVLVFVLPQAPDRGYFRETGTLVYYSNFAGIRKFLFLPIGEFHPSEKWNWVGWQKEQQRQEKQNKTKNPHKVTKIRRGRQCARSGNWRRPAARA